MRDAVRHIESMLQNFCMNLLIKYPELVADIRGIGAMWAVEFSTLALRDRFIDIAEEMTLTEGCGLKLLGCGEKSVRFMPPLNITDEDLNYAFDLFEIGLDELLREQAVNAK